MGKKYEAFFDVIIRVEFEDDGDLELKDQAFDHLDLEHLKYDAELIELRETKDACDD